MPLSTPLVINEFFFCLVLKSECFCRPAVLPALNVATEARGELVQKKHGPQDDHGGRIKRNLAEYPIYV